MFSDLPEFARVLSHFLGFKGLFRRGANSVCDILLLYRITDSRVDLCTGQILFNLVFCF